MRSRVALEPNAMELVIHALAQKPLPPTITTVEGAYRYGIRVALEARIRVDGEDIEEIGK